jgi:hypothetical protein
MLALPGLLIATGKLKLATQLLYHWRDFFFLHVPSTARSEISESPKSGEHLNLTGKDTPLLFIRALRLLSEELSVGQRKELLSQIQPGLSLFIRNYIHGDVPGIKICSEGFWVEPGPFAAGWMDAIIDGVPVTPRHGFAVDLCALWIDSLSFAIKVEENPTLKCNLKDNSQISVTELDDWRNLLNQNRTCFKKLFWSKESGYLADVHNGKTKDLSIRPNQLWALAIAEPLLSKSEGEKLLRVVEDELLTPRGLRTLSPRDPKYIGHYWGNQTQRDQAYHQGTVWPWLLGIYIDAVIAVRGKKYLEKLIPMLALIQKINHFAKQPEFIGKILFIENYDLEFAQKLIAGSDLWINTPLRPLEACGTSGMKAGVNGTLNFAVADGWWPEFYNGKNGWMIGKENDVYRDELQNGLDVNAIFHILETDIIPMYKERNEKGIPEKWVEKIKESVRSLIPLVTSERMLDDYYKILYQPAKQCFEELSNNEFSALKKLNECKKNLIQNWEDVSFVDVTVSSPSGDSWMVDDNIEVHVSLKHKGLLIDILEVQAIVESTSGAPNRPPKTRTHMFRPEVRGDNCAPDESHWVTTISLDEIGAHSLSLRLQPKGFKTFRPINMNINLTKWL